MSLARLVSGKALAAVMIAGVGGMAGRSVVAADGPSRHGDVHAASLSSADRRAILAQAHSAVFDTSYHATDTRRLFARRGTATVAGPMATIAPERGITAMTQSEMRQGRIVARVTTDGAYAPLGFAKGTNYIWVRGGGDGLSAIVVPEDSSVPPTELRYRVIHENINPRGAAPEARFRWDDVAGVQTVWTACAQGCCQTEPDWP